MSKGDGIVKEYDLILVGTGSGMNVVSALMSGDPKLRVAVIDKDAPGGICLTRGCIPSKLMIYPADVLRTVLSAPDFGIDVAVRKVDFLKVMERMRQDIGRDIEEIRQGLSGAENLDYYPATAEFTAPYTLSVAGEAVRSKLILLCTGSRPLVPPIKGLDEAGYLTSDTVLGLTRLPPSLGIIGGGYIAAEYGHFFSAMGSRVTVLGRGARFLPQEEPEVSELAESEMGKYLTLLPDHEVQEVSTTLTGKKNLTAIDRSSGRKVSVVADEVLVAAGRASNSDLLHPERAGVRTDQQGWILVDEHFQTSQPGIYAFGDALGRHMFKHVANAESVAVYYRLTGQEMKVDYSAVPHAVFTHPEIAAVGMKEAEAVEKFGRENVLLGKARYEDTAKGAAMNVKAGFVKVIVHADGLRLLGAHVIGPCASVLVQELVNLMYTPDRSVEAVRSGMHIHPALSEVVERAVGNLMPVDGYHHALIHEKGLHHHEH